MTKILDNNSLQRAQRYMRDLKNLYAPDPCGNECDAHHAQDTVRLYCDKCGEWIDSLDHGPLVAFCSGEECMAPRVFRQRPERATLWGVVVTGSILLIAIALIVGAVS
jgi:hypothetical protein